MNKSRIQLEGLNKNSTPCEICVAMNQIYARNLNKDEPYHNKNPDGCGMGPNGCRYFDRSKIKLLYLIYEGVNTRG